VADPWVAGVVLAGLALPTLVGSRRGLHDLLAGTWVVTYDADARDDVPEADFERLDRLRKERRLFRFREEDDPT